MRGKKDTILRLGLGLSAAGFLLSLVWLRNTLPPEPGRFGKFQLIRPEPAHIGNPGEVRLEIRSWWPPEPDRLELSGTSGGLEFATAQCRLTGISRRGFHWQCRRKFWAVEFGHYAGMMASYGVDRRELPPLQLEIQRRLDLNAAAAPPEPAPAPASAIFRMVLWFCLLSAIALQTGLVIWQRRRQRVLRQLKALQPGEAGGAWLWRIWRSHADQSWNSSWLGGEIRKMQFAPGGMTSERFAICRGLLMAQIQAVAIRPGGGKGVQVSGTAGPEQSRASVC